MNVDITPCMCVYSQRKLESAPPAAVATVVSGPMWRVAIHLEASSNTKPKRDAAIRSAAALSSGK